MKLDCFKTYDIRGVLGETLDPAIAERIGRAVAATFGPGDIVVGHDARETSPELAAAVARGLTQRGADVIDIGLCGTEEVYYSTGALDARAGVMVTASHNPIEYNGMKLVGPGSRPIEPGTELAQIRARAEADDYPDGTAPGSVHRVDRRAAFAEHVVSLADPGSIGPIRVLANAGNGAAGPAFDAILDRLLARGARIDAVRMHHDPDPSFPHGIPNPLIPENQGQTAKRVVAEGADIGIAWDGDFDRCFFFDETGQIVPGEFVVAILAEAALGREPGASIIHDPRVVWAIEDSVAGAGGKAVASKTGHAFLKAKMREIGAPYGGEMSAHHYFRDFFYCDSGMIPWVQVLQIVSAKGKPLSAIVADLRARFPSSGEINFKVPDPQATLERVAEALAGKAVSIDRLDGVSLDFGDWRMNLRASNTEPLLRLNAEAQADSALLADRVGRIKALIATDSAA